MLANIRYCQNLSTCNVPMWKDTRRVFARHVALTDYRSDIHRNGMVNHRTDVGDLIVKSLDRMPCRLEETITSEISLMLTGVNRFICTPQSDRGPSAYICV